MKIAFTGGRDFIDIDHAERVARLIFENCPHAAFCHGDARGLDRMIESCLVDAGFDLSVITKYPADWDRHQRRAGAIRNKRMLASFRPDVLISFPGGVGTAHCVKTAIQMGIHVIESRFLLASHLSKLPF